LSFAWLAQARLVLIVALLIAGVAVVGLALAGSGVFLAGLGLRALAHAVQAWTGALRSRNWQAAPGRITRSVIAQRAGGRSASFHPDLAYVYEVGGRSYSGTRVVFGSEMEYGSRSEAEDWVRRFPRGARATVFFDPGCPERATLDRRRPGLSGSLFVIGPCFVAAALLVPIGIDIVVGAFTGPPPFSEGELPPLGHQFGGLLLALGALFALIAALGALAGRQRRRLGRLLRRAKLTQVADVREGELVAVFGRAEQGDAELTESPVTRQAALYCRVRVVAGGQLLFEDVSHGDFRVRDDSGRLPVLTEDGTDEVPPSAVPDDAAVRQWIDASFEGGPLVAPAEFVVEQTLVAPQAPILAIGRARRDPDNGELCLQADPDDATSLVFSTQPRHALLRRLEQGRLRNAAFAVAAVLALLVGGSLLIG
jgi:hypothetical protein